MPLPAALLARLAKRGIVRDGKGKMSLKLHRHVLYFVFITEPEEVIAEDYSEKDDTDVNPENYEYQSRKRDGNIWQHKLKRRFQENVKGVKGKTKYSIFQGFAINS